MARPTDDFFELFRKKRVFSIKKVVGPKRLRKIAISKKKQCLTVTIRLDYFKNESPKFFY